jgi:hypothetical protein
MAYKDAEKQKAFQRQWQREQRLVRRLKTIEKLGGQCVDCGIKDHRVLQLDHTKPLLRNDRKLRYQTTGTGLCRKVLSGKVEASSIALRCANCHQIKTFADRTGFSNYVK